MVINALIISITCFINVTISKKLALS